MSSTDQLRYAEDQCNVADCLLSNNPYHVYLTVITTAGSPRPGVTGTRVRTDTRLTIGQGFLSFAPEDGYLNPAFVRRDGMQVVLSGGRLQDVEYLVGPIVYPFAVGSITGGFDTSNFQPTVDIGNTQVYIHIFGPGLDQVNGSYFQIKEIQTETDIFYHLVITSTGKIVPA